MPRQNLVFVVLAPLLIIALIAVVVSGFGTILLAVRAYTDRLYEAGQLTHDGAKLGPVFVALVVAAVFMLLGILWSRTGPPSPRH